MREMPESSPGVRALNPTHFDRPMTRDDVEVARTYVDEAQLQKACELFLCERGYVRSTENSAVLKNVRGWFYHLNQAKGNHILPDLVVWNADWSRSLPVELKTHNKFTICQRAMIEAGRWRLARSLKELADLVQEWEANA